MTTVATLCQDAAFEAKVLGQDQTLYAGDAQLILRWLNRMLDSWTNERQMIFNNEVATFTMTPGVATYLTSVLPKGRPTAITAMKVRLNNIDYEVTFIDLYKWNEISYKLTQSIPDQCYYNPNFPDGEMNFYPVPYADFTCTVTANYPLGGTTALTLADDLVMPAGYESAIVSNLAVEIWESFKGGEPPASLQAKATKSKAVLKRTNFQPLEMNTPFDQKYDDISNAFLYRGF